MLSVSLDCYVLPREEGGQYSPFCTVNSQQPLLNKQNGQEEKDVPREVKAFISYEASFFMTFHLLMKDNIISEKINFVY